MRRLIGVITVAAVALVVLPAASARSSAIQLRGRNELFGRDGESVRVRIPRPVVIHNPLVTGNDFRIRGATRAMVFLIPVGKGADHRPTYMGGRIDTFSDAAAFFVADGDALSEEEIALRRGVYKLVFVSESADEDISVTLKLEGLDGQVAATAKDSSTAHHVIKFSEPIRSGNSYATGADGRLRGNGMLIALTWFDAPVHSWSKVDFCQSRGPTPSDWMYLPGQDECDASSGPGGGETWIDGGASTTPTSRLYYATWRPSDAGISRPKAATYQQSVTMESGSPVDSVTTMLMWLTW